MQKLLLLSVLLMSFSWAAAQDNSNQSMPQDQSQSQTSQSQNGMSGQSQTPNNMGSQTTVKGCLNGSNGNYTLTDKSGTTYQLMGDSSKWGEHVGHEVKVMGTVGASAGAQTGESGGGGGMGGGSGQTLQVSSVKHVSKTCQSGGSMSH